jgi:hypothetical protein
MKNDKSDKRPATSATSATQEVGRTGLLSSAATTNDPLAIVGLGLGATDRARELVLKGLEYEQQQELQAFLQTELSRLDVEMAELNGRHADLDKLVGGRTGGRGRPPKGWFNIDVKRAGTILAADDFYYEKKGKNFSSQIDAIHFAIEIEKILFKHGQIEDRLFDPMTSIKTFQDSVSAGLQKLPEYRDRFLK